jgi:hypothetical protein
VVIHAPGRPPEWRPGSASKAERQPTRDTASHHSCQHTGRLARAGLGITVRGPAQDIAEQIAAIPDITYVLTGTGRFDVIAAADTSSETSLLRTIEQIRVLRGVNRVQSWRHLQVVKESYPRITQLDHRQNPH